MELNAIVQKILQTNDYVSLPGLGSIVRKYESARLANDGKTLLPPKEYFVFDPNRTFNDEALENYLEASYGLSKSEASRRVEEFCQTLLNSVKQNKTVSIPGIGSLKTGVDGGIELIADDALSTTFLPPVDIVVSHQGTAKVEANQDLGTSMPAYRMEDKSTPTVNVEATPSYIPATPKKSQRSFAAGLFAAVIVIGVVAAFIFIPEFRFWEGNKSESVSQVAVVVPDESIKPSNYEQPVSEVKSDSASAQNQSADSSINVVSRNEVKKHTSVIVPIDKKSALLFQDKPIEESKTFYIVIGSFASRDNAQKLIDEVSRLGYKPFILPGNNVYRVVIYQFTNRDRALRELERVRGLHLTSQAWLLTL